MNSKDPKFKSPSTEALKTYFRLTECNRHFLFYDYPFPLVTRVELVKSLSRRVALPRTDFVHSKQKTL